MGPIVLGRHDIHMVEEDQGTAIILWARGVGLQSGIQARSTCRAHQALCCDAFTVENFGQESRCFTFVPRWVRCIDLQVVLKPLGSFR